MSVENGNYNFRGGNLLEPTAALYHLNTGCHYSKESQYQEFENLLV